MKTSELLKSAKPFLWDGASALWHTDRVWLYICYAIDSAEAAALGRRPRLTKAEARAVSSAARTALRHIHNAISPHDTLTDWLLENVRESRSASQAQIQAYRLRWLNHLIKRFKAKGD